MSSTPKVPMILLARHGETSFNTKGKERFRSWLDVPLTNKGRKEAEEAGELLKGVPVTYVLASDMERTYETGTIIARHLGARVVTEYGLRPWNLGILTGQLVAVGFPLLKFYTSHPDTPVPGGESYGSFTDRLFNAFDRMCEFVLRHPEEPLVGVTHHSDVLLIMAKLEGKHVNPEQPGERPNPGEVVCIIHDGKRFKVEGIY